MVEENGQMRSQDQNKMIKPKKFKRQLRFPVNVISTFNKFEGLLIEECNLVETEEKTTVMYQGNITQEIYQETDKEIDEIQIHKSKKMKWKKFCSENPFEVFMDNHEEGINNIINRNVILKTPKHCLKKCKRCNFKKRTCVFDSSSCKAIQQRCFKCNKKGHYPQSSFCKAWKRSKTSKEKKKMMQTKILDSKTLQLVEMRIDQLESGSNKNMSTNVSVEGDGRNKHENIIPDNLIPILLMFIFLNYNFIVSHGDQLIKNESKKRAKINSNKSIIKAADYCARKFKKKQYDQQHFIRYCNKKLRTVLGDEQSPNLEESELIQKILGVYDNIYYESEIDQNQRFEDQEKGQIVQTTEDQNCSEQTEKPVAEEQTNLDEDEKMFSEVMCPFVIPQLDGFNDSDSEDGRVEKRVYAVNCELEGIKQIVTLLRSFNFLWISTEYHGLCSFDQNCFLCNMRSSCLRLRQMREKGPRSIKLTEFVSQLNQYESVLQWNWRDNLEDLPTFLEKTLELITKSEIKTSVSFVHREIQCENCKKDTNDQSNFIFTVDIEEQQEITIKSLLEKALVRNGQEQCVHRLIDLEDLENKCIILLLSKPTSINIYDRECFNGVDTYYNSHSENNSNVERNVFFRFNNQMYRQNAEDQICESEFGFHKNVSILSVFLAKQKSKINMKDVNNFIYEKPVQLKLHKQYLKHLLPEKHKVKQQFIKEYELERSKDEDRRSMQDQIDKLRNQNP